jgi:predicted signal transduction protein with EAL and GGDEF domain
MVYLSAVVPPPANVRRHFLPWATPLLPQAVAWLAREWSGAGPLNLSSWLVVVPTRQAGRRLREALAKLAARKGSGQRHSISLNLSGTTLNDERFLEFLLSELSQTELEPGALCFEITETAAITHMANVVYFMRQLKARGVRFALDDFGSGLSSLIYLNTLPVDILKID